MSIAAIVSVEQLLATNAALAAAGHGPHNFSIPAYTGAVATHAVLHCWDSPAFLASLQALPAVTILSELGAPSDLVGDAVAVTRQVIAAAGAQWGADIPALPSSGQIAAGMRYQVDNDIWYVIQGFNRSVYGAAPGTYPALLRRVRNPAQTAPWQQPLDQYDAYQLLNHFTGAPDRALYNGQEWCVSAADGAGNNVWQPGVFGWRVVGGAVEPALEPAPEPTWVDTGATIAGQAGQLFYTSVAISSLGLSPGQAIKLGTRESSYVGTWPGTNNLMQINPYVAASAGMTLWKWA